MYVCFIERLQKERGLYLSEHLPSLAMLNSSATVINKSKVSIKELLNLLSAEKESLSRYVLAYVDKVSKMMILRKSIQKEKSKTHLKIR